MATASSSPPPPSSDSPTEESQTTNQDLVKDTMEEAVMYKTKSIQFLGRTTPIILQNENGPCPLLAICMCCSSFPFSSTFRVVKLHSNHRLGFVKWNFGVDIMDSLGFRY